jgi:hypothetical protein
MWASAVVACVVVVSAGLLRRWPLLALALLVAIPAVASTMDAMRLGLGLLVEVTDDGSGGAPPAGGPGEGAAIEGGGSASTGCASRPACWAGNSPRARGPAAASG